MFPTPTPRPEATAAFDLDMSTIPQEMAVEAVQMWNTASGITSSLQIAIIVILVLAGIYIVVRALKDV